MMKIYKFINLNYNDNMNIMIDWIVSLLIGYCLNTRLQIFAGIAVHTMVYKSTKAYVNIL